MTDPDYDYGRDREASGNDDWRQAPPADHPRTNPGDGRTQCPTCGKYVWLVTHSCKGIRVAPPADLRGQVLALYDDCTVEEPEKMADAVEGLFAERERLLRARIEALLGAAIDGDQTDPQYRGGYENALHDVLAVFDA